MNKEDLIKLYKAIEVEKSKGNIKFKYTLLKNADAIKPEIDILFNIENDIDAILKPFVKERDAIIKELGFLDVNTNTYIIKSDDIETVNQYNSKVQLLTEKYKDKINEHNSKLIEYKDLLSKDLDKSFNFVEINIDDCPQDMGTDSLEVFMKFKIIK